ncbi:Endoribonuclease L-PSP [Burkholderia sp. lig30]|jgi:enamine deaminase RidA (YjgF/YER057c/UK114 family)|uniref:RidA family protein n=1 Tax=Burkholderia sp. lig30 TaxID=1192124 RepID=UPI0004614298|nr:RidA family protein [Burkholderia sp. lig30]KDB09253.1 Endoribonuclease L-PSP [Burkholderia sp. lig30]
MKEVIDTGLPPLGQPFSWAVRAGSLVFTAHGPVRLDGTIDTGPIEDQARLTFSNLARAMRAAGGSLDDVTQVQIQMTDIDSMPSIDRVYREFFRPPYPNRSSVAVKALVVPGMSIEIVASAVLADQAGATVPGD